MNRDKQARRISFWELLSSADLGIKSIVIPDLQRDYAEGRLDPETTQIRKNLIGQICECLKENIEKSLNFVYGTSKDGNFTPIDGQQRLTTLFLLHWYIFVGAKNDQEVFNKLNRFSYQTRETTKTFCEKLCMEAKPECTEKVSDWIKDQWWFSGNIGADPSVKSMLVVLDDIAEELKGCDESGFNELAAKLKSPDCKIHFLWFDAGSFAPEDLYIKMNSRGKYLTEFESFKAKLQPSAVKHTVLEDTFGGIEESVEFIGRINNEYSNLFYSICNTADADEFDKAMMNFFVSVIKCDQFSYVGQFRIDAKNYRDIFNSTVYGSVFYEKFINEPVKQWKAKEQENPKGRFENIKENELNARIVHSFQKIDYVLGLINRKASLLNGKSRLINRELKKYQTDKLIESNKSQKANQLSPIKDQLRQYAILEYLYVSQPDLSEEIQRDKLVMWKRFVSNVLENASDSKGGTFTDTADAIETICFFKTVIDKVSGAADYKALNKKILEACEAFSEDRQARNNNAEGFPPSINQQMTEELEKLRLMEKDDAWEAAILKAEDYFADGQIRFLLDFYREENEIISLEAFYECLALAKKLFTEDKRPNTDFIQWQKLQRAAFCCPDSSKDKNGYLLKKTNWQMHTEDASYDKMLAGNDLRSVFIACRGKETLNDALDGMLPTHDFAPEEKWKECFTGDLLDRMVQYNEGAQDGDKFSFIIAFVEDTILLLRKKQRVSGMSAEVNTFALYCKLPAHVKKELHFESLRAICDEEGKPRRYLTINDTLKIGCTSLNGNYINVDTKEEYTTYEQVYSRVEQNQAAPV